VVGKEPGQPKTSRLKARWGCILTVRAEQYNEVGFVGKNYPSKQQQVETFPEELPGKRLFTPVTVAFRRSGEIGAVGEMLAKCGETPIGAIN
jgi:hypothetical protein